MKLAIQAKAKLLITLLLLALVTFQIQAQHFHQELKLTPTSSNQKATRTKKMSGGKTDGGDLVRCSTMEVDGLLRAKYPSLPSAEKIERELQKNISEYKRALVLSKTGATVVTIPVVVHVIHNGQAVGSGANISFAQVKSQIDVLNEDYRRKDGTAGFNNSPVGADVEIEFALALRDPQGRTLAEPGINRINGGRASWDKYEDIEGILKPKTQWDPNKYLNMWTVEFGGETSKLLGYAQFPVLSGLQGIDDKTAGLANTDGLVMRYSAFGRTGNVQAPYNKGRTTTHEIGHWLGLRHIWGDMADCTGSDFCSDTPATGGPNYGCKKGSNSCTGEGSDMVENYMDYSEDGCMNIFTAEQKARIRTVLQKSPRRKELLASTVHLPDNSGKPFPAFSVSQTEVCAGTPIAFKDESSNNPTSWKWSILNSSSTIVASSTQQNPSFTLSTPGVYSVTLVVSNSKGENQIDQPNYITVLSGTGMTLPFADDFEGDEVLPGWSVFNPDNDREWILTDEISAGNNGSYSAYFDNYSDDTDPTGTEDAIISPQVDLSTNRNAELSFDVAYAMFEDEDGLYSDTIVVYYSDDCGNTYKPFWKKWGKDLATSATTDESFVPLQSEWRREKISLTFLNGKTVNLAISNRSGWGNNLYLDNISISAVVSADAPVAAFKTATTTVCEGEVIQFTDNSTNGPTSWKWSFPGGTPATSTEQNPSVLYAKAGTYSVSLTASNAKGSNLKTQNNYLSIVAKPALKIIADKENICDGDSVVLSVSGGKNYVWKDQARGGALGSGPSITVKPNFTSAYQVVGENESGCSSTILYEVTVKSTLEKPIVTISSVDGGITLSSSSPVGNQWYLNNKPIKGATEQTYIVAESGAFSVKVSDGECGKLSDPVTVTGDGDNPVLGSDYSVFPNPASGEVTISSIGENMGKGITISIYNALGVRLVERLLDQNKDDSDITFNLQDFAPGTYFILIEGERRVIRKTLLKI